MPIETNLNRPPFYDDYNANNNYYRILFRPSTAVQARELTQIQSIQQDQIEKFGDFVFKSGSIVEGCTISFDDDIQYVKIVDEYTNGTPVSTIDLQGKYIFNSANLQAYIQTSTEGSQGTPPDLKTVYIKYTTTGTYSNGAQQKIFDPSDILTVVTSANVVFGTIQVANSASAPVGNSYSARVTSGVIYQKGTFIRVEDQTAVVTKYSNQPNGVSIGFTTSEQIITPDIDETLLDNAQGSYNFNAPGAYRLKLIPTLVARDTATIQVDNSNANTDNFLSIVDFENGAPTRKRTDAQLSRLGDELAKRTYEESGNYIIDPFELSNAVRVEENGQTNTEYFNIEVDRGVGYVFGYRVEYYDKVAVPVRKGTDTATVDTQIITANFGNYFTVKELSGVFDVNNMDQVELIDAAASSVSSGTLTSNAAPIGNTIGTANILTIKYDSGTPGTANAEYNVYLFNIDMQSGKSISEAKSIYGVSGSNKAFADIVLSSSNTAVLQETNLSKYVIPLGQKAVKNLRDQSNTYNALYNVRTSNSVTFSQSAGSIATLNIPAIAVGTSGQELPYGGGTLSGANEQDFIIVATNSANTANLQGTVETSGNVVTGTGTDFSNTSLPLFIQPGDFVYVSNSGSGEFRLVTAVTNTTHITVNNAFTNNYPAGTSISRHIPAGSIINMTKPTANIFVSNNTSANIYLGTTLNKDLDVVVYYNLIRRDSVGTTKEIRKNRYVKIDLSANTTGPWSLGLPDVVKINNIHLGYQSGTPYSNTNPDVSEFFRFTTGQDDSLYDLAFLYLQSNTSFTVNSDARLLVDLDHFIHNKSSGLGFISIESYPIDDSNLSNTVAITTQEIPRYVASDGQLLDLRDCIDFRPIVLPTANSTNVIADATVNPSGNTTVDIPTGGAYAINPDENFESNFTFYLGRIDKVVLSQQADVFNIEGAPGLVPITPRDKDTAMTLGVVNIPPYPSLPVTVAREYDRLDYSITNSIQQNRRYTMRDIGAIDQRVDRLEYFTTLSLLEVNTKQLIVTDAVGNDRFKNGFLVDPMQDFTLADIQSQEFINYAPGIDRQTSQIRPRQDHNWIDCDFNVSTSTNAVKTGSLITLPYVSEEYISQPFASKVRNCAEGLVYSLVGTLTLEPAGDHRIDVTTNPQPATVQSQNITAVQNSTQVIIGTQNIVIPTTQITSSPATSYTVGDFVTDVSIQPFMRGQAIRFTANSIRPNTVVYAFFDDEPVTNLCVQTDSSFIETGTLGSGLAADSDGNVYGIFYVPAGRFRTGNRVFRLADVVSITGQTGTITTEAAAPFNASNINITKQQIVGVSRPPQIILPPPPPAIQLPVPVPPPTPPTPRPAPRPTPRRGPLGPLLIIQPPIRRPRRVDPLAQTIFIDEPTTILPGVNITKVDLFFSKKPTDASKGVTVTVNYVENGVPTPNIVPFGVKRLVPSEVNTSTDGSVATSFEFPSPVFLLSQKEYAVIVWPDNGDIGYEAWVAELGKIDSVTGEVIRVNSSIGTLYTSSTGRQWSPYQMEDLKLVLHRANFTSNTGIIAYNNSNTEYLKVYRSTRAIPGESIPSEKVFVSNGIVTVTGNTVTSTSNTVVFVSPANASVLFTSDKMIYISSNNSAQTDIRTIVSVPNTSAIIINQAPTFNDNNATIGYLYSNGELFGYGRYTNSTSIYLENSTANTTVNFRSLLANTGSTNALVIGSISGAIANLENLDGVLYNETTAQFAYTAVPGTEASVQLKGNIFTGNLQTSNTPEQQFTSLVVDETYPFIDNTRVVLSRSDELFYSGGQKSLQVTAFMDTGNSYITPVFDDIKSSILALKNIITVSNSELIQSETLPTGGTINNKYISRTVLLDQESEDLVVYLTAFRPLNTDILVYCKLLNGSDPNPLSTKYWTLMEEVTPKPYSSKADLQDLKELQYKMPVGNNTVTTETAFVNTDNSDVVRYYLDNGSYFDGYNSFAIKIVLVSTADQSAVVPRVSDMRAIALQV